MILQLGEWLDGYEQGKAAAEREFQESDAWNDYLAKVIADARADAFNEFVELYREFINAPCDEACFKNEIDECDGICIDCFENGIRRTNEQNKRRKL